MVTLSYGVGLRAISPREEEGEEEEEAKGGAGEEHRVMTRGEIFGPTQQHTTATSTVTPHIATGT